LLEKLTKATDWTTWRTCYTNYWNQISHDLTNKAIDHWLSRIRCWFGLKEDTLNTVWSLN